MKIKIALFIFSLLIFSSCKVLYYNYYGIKPLKSFNEQKYISFLSSLETSIFHFSGIVSSSKQFEGIYTLSNDPKHKKILYQPVQILYFKSDELISYHINCGAEPEKRNLNWNAENQFDVFPPHSTVNDPYLTLKLQQYQEIYPEIVSDKTYVILIFWTLTMENISENAIKTVKTNIINHNKQDSSSVFLINTDNFYINKF